MHVCLNKAAATMVYSLRAFFFFFFEPCSSSSQVLDCIYCLQPAEFPCDSSISTLTGMEEILGKWFESLDAGLFLAIIHLGLDGVMWLYPHRLGLEPGVITSVWSNAGMETPPRHKPTYNERVDRNHFLSNRIPYHTMK